MGVDGTRWASGAMLGAALLAGCSPTEDWRDVRPAGSGAQLLFPCKPASQTRDVPLAGDPVPMTLLACTAGANTFAFAHADVVDPARVTPALRALADAAAVNLGATPETGEPWRVDGMTPNAEARRLRLQGRLPDGSEVREEVVTFARGTRVFQATVVGPSPAPESIAVFFDSLTLPP